MQKCGMTLRSAKAIILTPQSRSRCCPLPNHVASLVRVTYMNLLAVSSEDLSILGQDEMLCMSNFVKLC